jgi:hypothetical protein
MRSAQGISLFTPQRIDWQSKFNVQFSHNLTPEFNDFKKEVVELAEGLLNGKYNEFLKKNPETHKGNIVDRQFLINLLIQKL